MTSDPWINRSGCRGFFGENNLADEMFRFSSSSGIICHDVEDQSASTGDSPPSIEMTGAKIDGPSGAGERSGDQAFL